MSDVSLMGKPTIGMNGVDLVLKVNEHHIYLIETKAKPVHLFFWFDCRFQCEDHVDDQADGRDEPRVGGD